MHQCSFYVIHQYCSKIYEVFEKAHSPQYVSCRIRVEHQSQINEFMLINESLKY